MKIHDFDLGKHGAALTVSIGPETMKPPPRGVTDSGRGGAKQGGSMTDDEARAGDPTELAGTATADTESVYAWALDEDDGEDAETVQPSGLSPRIITIMSVVASLVTVAAAALIAVVTRQDDTAPPTPTRLAEESPAPAAPAPAAAPPMPVEPPAKPGLSAADARFLDTLRGFGVPINEADPAWTANLGHALCETALDPVSSNRYPPGGHTVSVLTKGLMQNDPSLTWQQAFRLSNTAVDQFCPEVRGPSPQQIAALPPDARFLAMIQDRLGITPVDGTLVAGARQMCEFKASGATDTQIVDGMNSPNPREDEIVILETAIATFCPQYMGR